MWRVESRVSVAQLSAQPKASLGWVLGVTGYLTMRHCLCVSLPDNVYTFKCQIVHPGVFCEHKLQLAHCINDCFITVKYQVTIFISISWELHCSCKHCCTCMTSWVTEWLKPRTFQMFQISSEYKDEIAKVNLRQQQKNF